MEVGGRYLCVILLVWLEKLLTRRDDWRAAGEAP